MQACHCDICRKWGGGPFMSTPCKEATFQGPVTRYASSEAADRGFCATCGTHLFFFAKAAGIHAVPIGLFDDQSGLPFRAELFVDSRPDYYVFNNETKQMTGAEYRAKFG
ncbi:MAG TPA: GFA family protein [Alphaproteobacteria bacterium]|nr:GFA family protein [Alphaproteobacteria bacterium]